jgi:hypothetical protein
MRETLRRAAYRAGMWLLAYPFRLLLRLAPAYGRWERVAVRGRPQHYGAARARDLADYLRGPTTVDLSSVAEVEQWLRGCQFERDPMRGDDWSAHPFAFEYLRRGNCLDHALWAWRKLVDLGADAELVIGWQGGLHEAVRGGSARHAWVIVRNTAGDLLMEPAAKDGAMWRRLAEIGEGEYWPEFGVRRDGEHFTYGGYWHSLQREVDQYRTRREGAARGPT